MQSHFFVALRKSEMVSLHFLLLFEKVWLCDRTFLSLFEKVGLCDWTFLLFFERVWLCDRTFFVTLWKSVIVQSHFFPHFSKVRQKVQSHYHSFEKSDKKCNLIIALLKRVKICNLRMWNCPTLSSPSSLSSSSSFYCPPPYLHRSHYLCPLPCLCLLLVIILLLVAILLVAILLLVIVILLFIIILLFMLCNAKQRNFNDLFPSGVQVLLKLPRYRSQTRSNPHEVCCVWSRST